LSRDDSTGLGGPCDIVDNIVIGTKTAGWSGRLPIMEYLTKKELTNDLKLKSKKTFSDEILEKASQGLIDFKEVKYLGKFN
jgi:hypothetical protein